MANQDEKQRIRQRYRGVALDEIEKIPAIEDKDIFEDDSDKRVGVYVRVSTDDPRQTSSFELQRNHYTDLIDRRPGWHLVKIYADEGISGTSLNHRDAFLQMIEDCKRHKIDLIITKSVSRFARNIYDCIGQVRMLADLKPPVGVLFETENIYTLKEGSEMALSFIATLAQEESRTKSSAMNLSYEMRFSRGIFMTPELLGYDKDEDGNLVINEDEALTVRLIFFMFLYGYTVQQIAETLTNLKRVTKRGNYKWTTSSILGILQNERHCGDVIAHKTWTPNFLTHKSVKNEGENLKKPKYVKRNHHESIISRDDFIAVQQLISFSDRGRTGMLPQIHVVDKGALRGFVIINPRWAGFTAEDYLTSVEYITPSFKEEVIADSTVTPEIGTVDLRGFEIVRGQFFGANRACTITLTPEVMRFTASCLQKLDNCRLIELLFDPIRKLLVARPTAKGNRNAIEWLYFDGKKHHARKVLGRAYLPVIFELMQWNTEWPYSIQGECLGNGEDSFLLFDLNDAEGVIRQKKVEAETDMVVPPTDGSSNQPVKAMPQEWLSSFGSEYYAPAAIAPAEESPSGWNVQASGKPMPRNDSFVATSEADLKKGINSLIETMTEGSAGNE